MPSCQSPSVLRSIRARRSCSLVASLLLLGSLLTLAAPAAAAPTRTPWLSPGALAALPTSGEAWEELKDEADESPDDAEISDQDSRHDTNTLAAALVAARLDDDGYRAKARDGIVDAIGTEDGGRTLALGRNLPGYVLAAGLIDLASFDPAADRTFRSWLDGVRTENLSGRTLISTHEDRPNNWGTHAGAARIAASLYLGDTEDVAAAATVFRGYLGDRDAYADFKYGDLSWQEDSSSPVGINPAGATIDGHSVDGVLPDDQRRSGDFDWPPPRTNYAWEALQGAVVQAELLSAAGYDAWEWSDRALLRAVEWLHEPHFEGGGAFPAEGDDRWIPWMVNRAYGTDFPTEETSVGKNVGFTDWTHQSP